MCLRDGVMPLQGNCLRNCTLKNEEIYWKGTAEIQKHRGGWKGLLGIIHSSCSSEQTQLVQADQGLNNNKDEDFATSSVWPSSWWKMNVSLILSWHFLCSQVCPFPLVLPLYGCGKSLPPSPLDLSPRQLRTAVRSPCNFPAFRQRGWEWAREEDTP